MSLKYDQYKDSDNTVYMSLSCKIYDFCVGDKH